jgi:hypothetical protein
LRWLLALVAGVPAVVLGTGAFYSLVGVRGGHHGKAIFLAAVHGLALWVVFRLARCERIPAALGVAALAVSSLGPVVVGHAMGYGDMKSLAHRLVREDTAGRYPGAWKTLDRDELFPRWVGSVTGTDGGGAWGYLRVQAEMGWEGWAGIKYRVRVDRRGLWVWIAWLGHVVLLALAGTVAFLAARSTEASPKRR